MQNRKADTPDVIEEYIAGQADEIRPILEKVRAVIREVAPNATEKIAWQMPTFWQGKNLIHYYAQKKHLGIYPGALENLSPELLERLKGYKTTKGAIQFPYHQPIDYELIADIARWRVSVVEHKGD